MNKVCTKKGCDNTEGLSTPELTLWPLRMDKSDKETPSVVIEIEGTIAKKATICSTHLKEFEEEFITGPGGLRVCQHFIDSGKIMPDLSTVEFKWTPVKNEANTH